MVKYEVANPKGATSAENWGISSRSPPPNSRSPPPSNRSPPPKCSIPGSAARLPGSAERVGTSGARFPASTGTIPGSVGRLPGSGLRSSRGDPIPGAGEDMLAGCYLTIRARVAMVHAHVL